MIRDIQGLRKITDCSMPSSEKERIHKAETASYNQAIDDVLELVRNCSIPHVSDQRELLAKFSEWLSYRNITDDSMNPEDWVDVYLANCS